MKGSFWPNQRNWTFTDTRLGLTLQYLHTGGSNLSVRWQVCHCRKVAVLLVSDWSDRWLLGWWFWLAGLGSPCHHVYYVGRRTTRACRRLRTPSSKRICGDSGCTRKASNGTGQLLWLLPTAAAAANAVVAELLPGCLLLLPAACCLLPAACHCQCRRCLLLSRLSCANRFYSKHSPFYSVNDSTKPSCSLQRFPVGRGESVQWDVLS